MVPPARGVGDTARAAQIPPARGRREEGRGAGAAPARRQIPPARSQGKAGKGAAQGKKGGGAQRGAERRIIRLAPETTLLYQPEAKKRGKSAERLEQYRAARTIGEFFGRHPGTEGEAAADLTNDLKKGLCETDPPLGPCDFDSVRIDQVGRARAILAAAVRGRAPDARAAAVGAWVQRHRGAS